MPIDIRHANDLDPSEPLDGSYDLVVVIDVIRAFTAAPWVLRQGASRLFLAPDAGTALHARDTWLPSAVLMKDGTPDPRFELPNAPGAIAGLDLTGTTIIQTTGNGARGAHLVSSVPVVACASFATATATARLVDQHDRVLLLPTEGDEDYALAEFFAARATGAAPSLAPLLQRVAASAAGVECVKRGHDPAFPGVHPRDLQLCQGVDTFTRALVAIPTRGLLAVALW